ncbi:phosphotransferase [Mycobacterium sp. NPDC048908]|uniref:phosphotransferase family protein n=1 Tax=Mycobacterium sp. NPDC048908 TaxID=3364292 RepID=UPI0037104FD9
MFVPLKVLIADNDANGLESPRAAWDEFDYLEKLDIDFVQTVDAAIEAARDNYYDLAFIDLVFTPDAEGDPGGQAVLTSMSNTSPGCVRAIATGYKRENIDVILNLVSSLEGGEVLFVNKFVGESSGYVEILKNKFSERFNATWELDGIDRLAQGILDRGRVPGLRPEFVAVKAELVALLFDVFNRPASIGLVRDKVRLVLSPMEQQGMSASVVIKANLNYGTDQHGLPIRGAECVLKVGPKEDIRHEANQYVGLIRMGVPSRFRVDLVGWSQRDSLGAICYSMAGGGRSPVRSLDALLATDEFDAVRQSIRSLFSESSQSWMAIAGAPITPHRYYFSKFRSSTERALEKIENFLVRSDTVRGFDSQAGQAIFEDFTLEIVRPGAVTESAFTFDVPACLVHGDLHGGNILISDLDGAEVSMIDYATAGMGPRFTDGAALTSTLRLAQVDGTTTPRTALSIAKLSEQDYDLLVAFRDGTEQDLSAVTSRDRELFALMRLVAETMLANFDCDRTTAAREWAQTLFAYGLSIFVREWTDLERMRIVAFVAASSRYLKEAGVPSVS